MNILEYQYRLEAAKAKRLRRQFKNIIRWETTCLGQLNSYLDIVYGKEIVIRYRSTGGIDLIKFNPGLTWKCLYTCNYEDVRDNYKEVIRNLTQAYKNQKDLTNTNFSE